MCCGVLKVGRLAGSNCGANLYMAANARPGRDAPSL